MKRLLPFIAALITSAATAQTVPNGGITQGQVWTTAQWIAGWQSKTDITNGFLIGNQVPVAGSAMQVDRLLEASSPLFPIANEGGIWPSTAYVYAGVSQTVNALTVPGQGSSGPLTGFFSFINNNGATAQAVGILGDCVARTANATCFGANLIARNAIVNNAKLVGLEIDVEPAAGTTVNSASAGILMNIFNIAASDPTPVMQVGSLGGGIWGNGILTSHIAGVHYAVQSGDPTTSKSFINTVNAQPFVNGSIVLGTAAGQAVNFGGQSFGTSPYLFGDVSGNLVTTMGTAGAVILQKPNGANEWVFDQFGNLSAATGAMAIKTNGSTALTISSAQIVSASQPVQLASYTVATLPTCNAGIQYSVAAVTDATAPTYNAALTGGGAVKIPVFCTGAAWTSH